MHRVWGWDQLRIPGNHKNTLQIAGVAEDRSCGTGEAVRPLTIMVLVVELDGDATLQTEADGGGAHIALRPPISRGAIAFGEFGLDIVAAEHVQDVSLTVDDRDHEIVGA